MSDQIPSTWAGQQGDKLYQAVQVFLRRLGFLISGNGTSSGPSGQNWPNVVQPAFGGMRFRTDTPVSRTLGTVNEKLTDFNEQTPIGSSPLHITFDGATDEIVLAAGQGGYYLVSIILDFDGQNNRDYYFQFYVDSGSGPQPAGDEVEIRLGSQSLAGELGWSVLARVNGAWRISLWARANTNASFAPRLLRVDLARVSAQLPDNHGSEVYFGSF